MVVLLIWGLSVERTYRANLPHKLFAGEQIRANESLVAANLAIELFKLMEDAGKALFCLVVDNFEAKSPMTVLCGYGNNGGDGYIVARLAKIAGWKVRLVQIGDARKLSSDAAKAAELWRGVGGKVEHLADRMLNLPQGGIIIDALLGTGLNGEVRSEFARVISEVNNNLNAAVCSVDIPSGLNSDTGQPMGCAIKADITCTFIGVKQGLLTAGGGDYCGKLYFAGLGIDQAFEQMVSAKVRCFSAVELADKLPRRNLSAHKGQCGHVLLIGGNIGMSGAIRMAAVACLRAGAGLVSVLTHRDNVAIVASQCAELMVHGVTTAMAIGHFLQKADVVVLGPGLGQDDWAKSLLVQVRQTGLPKVIDADGLNLLALPDSQQMGEQRSHNNNPPFDKLNNTIITPHPKEAARLLNVTTAVIQADRFKAVKSLADKKAQVVLLKGYGTLISDSSLFYLNTSGNPGMATAGMGDVLSGILGALLAQGLSLLDAATVGAYIHGAAADIAATDGQRGMMATDLYPHIRALVNPK
jgi:hydroxyethylthiazole kinase-like uncharacterized protein yjeF